MKLLNVEEISCYLVFVSACAYLQDKKGMLNEGLYVWRKSKINFLEKGNKHPIIIYHHLAKPTRKSESQYYKRRSPNARKLLFCSLFFFFPTEQFSFTFKSGIVVGPYYIHSLQETLFWAYYSSSCIVETNVS